MNEFMKRYELVISTLSPVHIGCGEDYIPTEYVVDAKGILHKFNVVKLANNAPATLASELDAALEQPAGADQLKNVSAILKKYRDEIVPLADAAIPMVSGVFKHYNETQGRNADFNRNGVERSSYNSFDQQLYIPGSSLKGAIRTALLDEQNTTPISPQLLRDIAAFNCMIEEFDTANGKKQLRLKANHSKRGYEEARKDIEKSISAVAGKLSETRLCGTFSTDPFRAIKIADAQCCEPLMEREIRFCINRSRSGRKSQAQDKGLYTRLEYLLEFQSCVMQTEIEIHDLQSVAGTQKDGKKLTPEATALLDWNKLIKRVNAYYLPRLENDVRLVQALKLDSKWLIEIQSILQSGLKKEIQDGNAMLLRVGKHGGADCNTVDGRQIKIMLNEDQRQNPGNPNRMDKIRLCVFDDKPRTTWFCADDLANPGDYLPHGWIVLSSKNCEWLSKLSGYQRFQEKRQKQIDAEVQKAATAKLEAERLSRLATLSPAMLEVENFIAAFKQRSEQMLGRKENPNADFHNRARKLASTALESSGWTPDEKRAAADAIAEWLPKVVSGIDKDQLKKLKLGALRGNA